MDYRAFYERYFPNLKPNEAGEMSCRCPFHGGGKEQNPSMSINLESGLWKCFACDKAGDVYTFYQEQHKVSFREAKLEVDKIIGEAPQQEKTTKADEPPPEKKVISREEVDGYHERLLSTQTRIDTLNNARGLTRATIEEYRIGWDGQRYTIPIEDENGDIVNLRRYSTSARDKMISYAVGYGAARLYPIYALDESECVISEGEMDCLIARQNGFNAITPTGGAGVWKDEWTPLFRNKDVFICFDVDKAGRAGAETVAKKLYGTARSVHIVKLPLNDRGADITDYFVKNGYQPEDFRQLMKEAAIYVPPADEPLIDESVYTIHLSQASHAQYTNKRIRFDSIVSGKDLAPYIVPHKVSYTCPIDFGEHCATCALSMTGGRKELVLNPDTPLLLEMIACPDTNVKGVLKRAGGVFAGCKIISIDVLESQNIEEVFLIPDIDFSFEDTEYVLRRAFYVGHGLRSNQAYRMKGITLPDPRTQYATHLLYDVQPAQDTISSFEMTPELHDELKVFQAAPGKVHEKLREITRDISLNITKIYGRDDVLMAMDMVYHSVLSFKFMGKRVQKGWLEILVLGDTRTGKTETAQSLIRHFSLGEFVTGENASYAGLVGGMNQVAKRWSIVWGKMPLNDRRILFVDETSGLSLEAIANMSGVRSSGIAEITKIQTERTQARTRMVWISNPRSARTMDSYSYGVDAVMELFGKPEDIARLDFVVTSASREVEAGVINSCKHETVKHVYTGQLCRNLILWAWSRRSEDIVFHDDATQEILDAANKMGAEYSPKVPLVEIADQRIKIARLAVAIACRLFSTTDGKTVIVTPEHVEVAVQMMEDAYRKPSLAYFDMSVQDISARSVSEKYISEIEDFIKEWPEVLDLFAEYDRLQLYDIENMLDLDRSEVKAIVKFLTKTRLIERTSNGYKKKPFFIELIRKERSTNG